jgi:5-(carboxyamino)imidazole ribonucleotide synthase
MTPYDLGILGGGQLARMTVLAAHRAGVRCLALDPESDCPAAQVGDCLPGRLDDPEALASLLRACGRVTLENEFVPAAAVRRALELADSPPDATVPSVECLATVQDKLAQREALAHADVPQPRFEALAGPDSLPPALARLGGRAVVKRRFGGYDGRGTWFASSPAAVPPQAFEGLGLLAEEHVPFVRELAAMVVRACGATQCFPVVATAQREGVCDLVWTLGTEDDALVRQAEDVARRAVEAVGGSGLFGVEMFERADGAVLVNEIAPRPHNSGHYTLDWGGPSQFEAHWRACLGLPMPPLEGGEAAMANILGPATPGDWQRARDGAVRAEPSAFVHWYGKSDWRPGRKLGHINAAGPGAKERAERARAAFLSAWSG